MQLKLKMAPCVGSLRFGKSVFQSTGFYAFKKRSVGLFLEPKPESALRAVELNSSISVQYCDSSAERRPNAASP